MAQQIQTPRRAILELEIRFAPTSQRQFHSGSRKSHSRPYIRSRGKGNNRINKRGPCPIHRGDKEDPRKALRIEQGAFEDILMHIYDNMEYKMKIIVRD